MGVNIIHDRFGIFLNPQDEIHEIIHTLMMLMIIKHVSHGVNYFILNNPPDVNIIKMEDMDKYPTEVCIPIKIITKVVERTFWSIK